MADEVVNIDLTAEELINRLKEGKIYAEDKIQMALTNFFKSDQILQLRELALKEVASQVVRKVEHEKPKNTNFRQDKLLACISSNDKTAKIVIRKTARLASYYNSKWMVLYVQTPKESSVRIPLAKQRYLINNLKLATAANLKHYNFYMSDAAIWLQQQKLANAIFQYRKAKELFPEKFAVNYKLTQV